MGGLSVTDSITFIRAKYQGDLGYLKPSVDAMWMDVDGPRGSRRRMVEDERLGTIGAVCLLFGRSHHLLLSHAPFASAVRPRGG